MENMKITFSRQYVAKLYLPHDDVIKNFKMLQLDWKSVQVLIKYGDEGFQ